MTMTIMAAPLVILGLLAILIPSEPQSETTRTP
jgi:hypothetical protein